MNIAVYCGSTKGKLPIFEQAARELGRWIGENHHTLVYGGSNVGLMGIIADESLASGAQVLGVIPTFLKAHETVHEHLTQLETVETMSQRKQRMADLSQAFIALPGGPGTLEEITEVVSWARVGQNPYPCVFFNVNNYYQPLEEMYNQMVAMDFLTPEDRKRVFFARSLEEIAHFIDSYHA